MMSAVNPAREVSLVLLAGPPEDRLAGGDRLARAVGSAHLAGTFENRQDLRVRGGMADDSPAWCHSEDRRLDG